MNVWLYSGEFVQIKGELDHPNNLYIYRYIGFGLFDISQLQWDNWNWRDVLDLNYIVTTLGLINVEVYQMSCSQVELKFPQKTIIRWEVKLMRELWQLIDENIIIII